MDNQFLTHSFIFLASASLFVPLASRFKLSSVIGYLLAGILIGPYGFKWIGNHEQIMHFAEFGVIMMLFIIGLELEPLRLWRMRKMILGLGGLQVIVTALVLTGLALWLTQHNWQTSLTVGMALALSSTALVLQMLQEKSLLKTAEGERSFAVLLFQDMAVIPILLILPLLATSAHTEVASPHTHSLLHHLPHWMHPLVIASIIAAMIAAGRFLSHHLFFAIARTNLREAFTGISLALIVGITLLMDAIGISPALGAFIAGVVLANSEYKRVLETDLEPFKGLLLGLFFISVGMGMNFRLFSAEPTTFIMALLILLTVKAAILMILGRWFGLNTLQTLGFALGLSQTGEFAFVLFAYAKSNQVISSDTAQFYTMIVALSMLTTPFLMAIYHRVIVSWFIDSTPENTYDPIPQHQHVILVGYGRFGQVIGRFLSGHNIKLNILEKNPSQIKALRKFGFKGYFGDAARLDVLHNAGASHANLLIIAVGQPDVSLKIAHTAKQAFPHLKIYARARNRSHAYQLNKAGVHYFRRETFDSALTMAQEIMVELGQSPESLRRKARAFLELDEASLKQSFEFFEQEEEMINFVRQVDGELEKILQSDMEQEKPDHEK